MGISRAARDHQSVHGYAAAWRRNHGIDIELFEYFAQIIREHRKARDRTAQGCDIGGRFSAQSIQQPACLQAPEQAFSSLSSIGASETALSASSSISTPPAATIT